MKIIFLLTLLVNIAFFMWESSSLLRETKADDHSLQQIVLLNGSQKSKKTTFKGAYCYYIGPFSDTNELNEWGKTNKISDNSYRIVHKDRSYIKHYMVYFPAASSTEEASYNVEKIIKKGITDLWLFKKGPFKDAISLGVFNKQDSALSLIKKLSSLGIETQLKPIVETTPALYSRILTVDRQFKKKLILSNEQQLVSCKTP